MLARLSALVIWALVAATAVFWGLRLWVRAPSVPANAVAVSMGAATNGDLTRLLGVPPVDAPVAAAAPEAASRFRLVGVMAPKASAAAAQPAYGVALIAVDGKPAKAFTVGSSLDTGLVLQSVSLRSASLGPAQGAAAMKLELPALPPAATGSLPVFSIPAPGGAAPALPSGIGSAIQPAGPRMLRAPAQPANPNPDLGQTENFNGAATE